MGLRVSTALLLAGVLVLGLACTIGRGTVAPRPGETPEELEAAGDVLAAVGGSVPVIDVRVSALAGSEQRRTVGVVVGENRRILMDATALSLEVGEGEHAETAHTRSIKVVFHPGGDAERRRDGEVRRMSEEHGLALLSLSDEAPPALPLSDDVSDDSRCFLVGLPLSMSRPVVQAGRVRGYRQTSEGRFLAHTAGHDAHVTGPIVDPRGELIGLQIADTPGDRMAIPAVEIAGWMATPDPEELEPSEPGHVVGALLSTMDVPHRLNDAGRGYVLPRPDGADLVIEQVEGIISVRVDLGTLHVGDAIEGLRSNYSDPVGAIALRPVANGERVTWVARLPADVATAPYLSEVTRIASLQAERWRQLQAGLEPDYPYEHYPGGDEEAQETRLAEIIDETGLVCVESGDALKLNPEAAVPVFANVFRGMAYVYAYSGGMPGDGASEQEQTALSLLQRNWELPLGRLALDKHLDLAWEAQVPMDYLTADHLQMLVRVCQSEVARLKSTYGDVPFNEQ